MRQWLSVVAFALAAAHYISIAATGAYQLYIPLLLVCVILAVLIKRKPHRLWAWMPRGAGVILILSLLADLFVLASTFEENRTTRQAFQLLLQAAAVGTPFSLIRPTRIRRLLPILSVLFLLLPPGALTVIPRLSTPGYGFTAVLIGILNLLAAGFRPLHPKLIGRVYSSGLFLIGLALVPLVWTVTPTAPVEQAIELILMFGVGALILPKVARRSVYLSLLDVFQWTLLPWMLFLLARPSFIALNSNISSVQLEWAVLLMGALLWHSDRKKLALIVIILALATIFRIEARMAIIACLVGFLMTAVVLALNTRRGRALVRSDAGRGYVVAGLLLTLLSALLAVLLVVDIYSIQARRLFWSLALKTQFASLHTAIAGTGNFGYFFYLFRSLTLPLSPIAREVLSFEPAAVGHNPHSDYVLMLYGGGLAYLFTFIFFTWQTVRSAMRTEQAADAPFRLGAIATLLTHSFTEPLTSTLSTSFVFWITAASLRFSGLRSAYAGKKATLAISASVLAVSLISVASDINRIPVQRFWRRHAAYESTLRQNPDSLPIQEIQARSAEIQEAVRHLTLAEILSPLDNDVYRQKGDLLYLLWRSDSPSGMSGDVLQASLESYCSAFIRSPIPVHFAGIRRALAGLPERATRPCPNFADERQVIFETFDPIGHVSKQPY